VDAACHTAVPGEECFEHLMWAMQAGIFQHPDWYPGLTARSAFEDFQLVLHNDTDTKCLKPCPRGTLGAPDVTTPELDWAGACHTAVPGEECFEHLMWAMQTGIFEHPERYPGLNTQSASEDFQLVLHNDTDMKCWKPCPRANMTTADEGSCHTTVPGEECFEHLMWARQIGIFEHPDWYPGLTTKSEMEDFQLVLRDVENRCPTPCPRQNVTVPDAGANSSCHTAVPGEECYVHVMWAMQTGINSHPQWYNNLTNKSAMEDFQTFMHGVEDRCPVPCPRESGSWGSWFAGLFR